jgi:hypothetical protein
MKWIPRYDIAHQRLATGYSDEGICSTLGDYETIWTEPNPEGNILVDTGEEAILSAFFATTMANFGAPPANLYLALDARTVLAETDTLATLTGEVKALSGGARIAVSSAGTGTSGQDFYINQPGAYYRADSKTVEWTAGENFTAVLNLNLVSDATAVTDGDDDHLICTKALSASRTLLTGDKLQASMYIGLSE